jgi:hypothetical protein
MRSTGWPCPDSDHHELLGKENGQLPAEMNSGTTASFENMKERYGTGLFFLTSLVFLLSLGCATSPPPRYTYDICEIFRQNPRWYKHARNSSERWGVPIPILMAIVHQESRFEADARPPRRSCLGIIPGPRPSSAYGYTQASDETWREYRSSVGNRGADRDNFRDAVDFVGWYCHVSHIRCGISKRDTYHLYLAYHEGHGGFDRRTYQKKAWLLRVAQKVNTRANTYQNQLTSCERRFQGGGACCLGPF